MRNRGWLVYLVGGLLLCLAAGVSDSANIIAINTQIAGWAAVGIGLSIARKSPRQTGRPWTFFALAASAFLVAGIVRAIHAGIMGVDRPFPSPADAIALGGHVMLILGSTLLGHLRAPDRDRAAIIDGTILAIALQTMVWAWLLWPYMNDGSIHVEDRAINAVYAFMTMAVLATVGRLAVGPGARTLSYRLLAGAVFVVFLQDVVVTIETVGATAGTFGQKLAAPIFILFGAAALHPDRLRIAEAPARLDVRLTWRRVAMLVAALLINPAVVGIQLALGQKPALLVVLVSSTALILLVMARFALLARAQERAVEVQRIQRDANGQLAASSSRHAMHQAALGAALRLGTDPNMRVSLAQAVDGQLQVTDATGPDAAASVGTAIRVDQLPATVITGLNSLQPTVVDSTTPVDLGSASNVQPLVSLLVTPLASQGALSGAIIITTTRPMPATVRESMETLASTMSLALESATLTEDLLRRQSERRFRALVENSSDIVLVVNDDRLISFASPVADRLLGLDEDTLMGSHPARWVHPDDWPDLAAVLNGHEPDHLNATGELEVRIRHTDDSYRWFEIRTKDLHGDPEIQGMVVTAREITDRKAAEERLASSEARFRALVQNSSDVVAVVDQDGLYSYVSPAIEDMLGYTPQELIGTPAVGLFAPEELDHFEASYPELASELPDEELTVRRIEARVVHRSGETRTLDVSVTDMRHEPAVNGIVLNGRDITTSKALEHDLRYQALHDTLTGLANRTMFTNRTAAAMRSASPDIAPVSALFIDLDDFKTVNDSLGHAAGDELLQEVARRLKSSLMSTELPARLGGDEFAVLVVADGGERGALAVADQILALVAEPFNIQGREIRVTCSIGVAMAGADDDAEVLLRSADVAMYLAKDGGKNQAAVFEEHLHTSVFERLELKADLIRAIDDGHLHCQYQPIVSLQTGAITGVEALVRWNHPTRGRLAPDSFIPLAEETGLVVPLGSWVLREACRQLQAWQLQMPSTSSFTMSVNLSVRQLAHDNIVAEVREAIEEFQIDPSTLTLEITETTLMHDTEVNRHRLAQLRDVGVSLAVDDFGTGYSSLQYVQRFPIDIIKIDRSFVTGLGTNPGNGAVVQSMIELAQRLGVHTVAEGIERPEQVTILQSLGADLGQGYLFSRPVDADKIDALLAASPAQNPRFLLR